MDKTTHDTIATYDTLRAASEATGVNAKSISHCVVGRYRTAGGFIWRKEYRQPYV